MIWLVTLPLVAGVALLAMSLPPINAILRMLGDGCLRTSWKWLRGLIIAFMFGYVCFGVLSVGTDVTVLTLIVTMILTAGGAFVFIVARLSALTTNDIVRISALERDVIRDPLTGLFNRRYLDAQLDQETASARQSGIPFSALVIDLDHFKHINDTYGHAAGDHVIRHVAALLVSLARVNDAVTRYGGEEFVILARDCDLDEVTSFGERIRASIAASPVALSDGRLVSCTASLGAATFMRQETAAEFLRRADEALYSAKNSGRNRVCRCAAIPTSTATVHTSAVA